jgi:SAM-dependent methyltransferase
MVQKASETSLRENVEYRLYDGLYIPSEKEYFDCLTSVYVLQHVTAEEDFVKLADEFRRVLRPGGKACLLEQVSASLSHEEGTPDDFNLRRTPSHYVDVFNRNGFDCHEWRLIRTSSASVWLAEQWFFPSFLFSTLAATEALISRFRNLSHLKYADCLFVFVKKQGDKA